MNQMEERSKVLYQRKGEFYNNIVTVQQEIDLLRRKSDGRKK